MSLSNLHGRAAWVFEEDDYDIDLIIGVRNIKLTDVKELAALAMSDYTPGFAASVRKGDLLIGGHNFGYGHPHYPAMRAMRHLGIAAVIAESFSPGFFRGEMSMGFPLITCEGIRAAVARGDVLTVDWDANEVKNLRTGQALSLQPFAASERGMLEAGGLIPYLKRRMAGVSGADAQARAA
ncbi:3-isopropylmalate/(R)-2-methylmalate dehydratase small subunit [Variovorax boronicumulans]|uniref:3-isopropylmalate dehydratase n=1 Tax=Variovorax boronicumulans TaxID=436515 RepID=A0AAW8DUH4_9BURK|nr:3-isopropylmalate dehydratase [Variovorax boronicumulans]MDP9877710.1 3-isopropylmalate/(R)-2-methylmalate dehydratase small subunit [Variovorax boronicumulans]MDP9922994.1 3-isopropylmalate/(R)-2-methylmalate dehydratase small subunit [Variovorax boronicumulans]